MHMPDRGRAFYAGHYALGSIATAMMLGSVAAALAGETPQQYPTRPVRWVVPFVAGGGVDVVARAIADKLTVALQKPVVVDNRGGAAGSIGTELVANSPPDGYNLLSISSTVLINQAMRDNPSYDLRSLAAITQLTSQSYVFTSHVSVPARTLPELIALAKAKPRTITYASSGVGSVQHLAGAMLAKMANIELVHVPYKGGGAAHNDLVAGQVQMEITLPLTTYSFVKSGRLRYLAVTSKTRLKLLPDVPAVAETLPGYEIVAWYGLMAPAKTPEPIISRLNAEVVKILKMPEVGGRFASDGTEPVSSSPAAFQKHIETEYFKWRDLVKSVGITPE